MAGQRLIVETTDDGMVQIEVFANETLEFRALRRGDLKEGLTMADLLLQNGPDALTPKLRGASYPDIARALSALGKGDRFTSLRLTDDVVEEGVHDRLLVLKNVSSALTKLRKREVAWLRAAGKQGKSMVYEIVDQPSMAEVMADLQD